MSRFVQFILLLFFLNAPVLAQSKIKQSIHFGVAARIIVNQTGTVSATATSGLAVSYSSATPAICNVNGNSVTGLKFGDCKIHANQPGNATYSPAAQVTQTIHIVKTQTINFGAAPVIAVGHTAKITAKASSRLAVTYSTATPEVCSVKGNSITGIKVNTCIINASQAGDSHYTAAPLATLSFDIAKAQQTIHFAAPPKIAAGGSELIHATASSGLIVSFTSTTGGACSVSGNRVTASAVGLCTISANQPGDSNYNAAATVNASFNIAKGHQSIQLGAAPSIAVGGTGQITATASSGLPVSIASHSTGICTVNGNQVTGVKTGTCQITATQTGNANYNAAAAVHESFTISKGASTIVDIKPTEGASATNIVVHGTGFTAKSKVMLGTQSITPQFIDDTHLSFVVPFSQNLKGELTPLAADSYPVSVDGSNTVDFSVMDLPVNPNPPGQLIAEQTSSLFQNIAVAAPQFQAQVPQLLNQQQGNPSAQKYIKDLANLINYANTPAVQAALNAQINQIDQQSLDTMERSLLPAQNINNTVQSTNSVIQKNVKKTANTRTQAHQQSADSSCFELTNGDDWLSCRKNLKMSLEDGNTVSILQFAQLADTLSTYTHACAKAASLTGVFEEVAVVCEIISILNSRLSKAFNARISDNTGTLRKLTANIIGRDLAIDNTTDTILNANSAEVNINLHLNNYDNNENLSLQTAQAKYINGATLEISSSLDWVKISTEEVTDDIDIKKYIGKIPGLDELIKKIINLGADKVNNKLNQPDKILQISNNNILSIPAGVGADCNQKVILVNWVGDLIGVDLAITQSTDLKWLVKNSSSQAKLGKYIDTVYGCNYLINDDYRLPTEEKIDTKIQFSIKRYPEITINVIGDGYVAYEKPALSGNASCTSANSPCVEYFDLSPKPSLPADPNYTNLKLTAYNSDGTEAGVTKWTGDSTVNCTGNASCLITPDPTNAAPSVVTANMSVCSIGAKGPAGGIIFYVTPGSTDANCHGLEAAPEDQAPSTWGCWGLNISQPNTYLVDGETFTFAHTSEVIGTGAANTATIIASCGTGGGAGKIALSNGSKGTTTNAAATASAYNLNGYSDWYLPSKDELKQLIISESVVGVYGYYWSSTENLINCSWSQTAGFFDDSQYHIIKDETLNVRAIRTF